MSYDDNKILYDKNEARARYEKLMMERNYDNSAQNNSKYYAPHNHQHQQQQQQQQMNSNITNEQKIQYLLNVNIPQPYNLIETQAHPANIKLFLDMDIDEQNILRHKNINLYYTYIKTLQKMYKKTDVKTDIKNEDIDKNDNNQNYYNSEDNVVKYEQNKIHNFIIDFRNNLIDIDQYKYTIATNLSNIRKINLKSCIINQIYNLENEPYIYLVINNIKGEYDKNYNIFCKLELNKVKNGFLNYKSEKSYKIFNNLQSFNKLTFSFLKHDYSKIMLNNIPVCKISKKPNNLKIYTKTEHYITIGDKINISKIVENEIINEVLIVEEIHDKCSFITNMPFNKCFLHKSETNTNTLFEKCDIKVVFDFEAFI